MKTLATQSEPILFKQPFSPKIGWINYGLALSVLLIFILMLAKKHKPGQPQRAACQLIEKKQLSNKTAVYIIEYQQKRFLLAENPHALAIHSLLHETTDESI